MIKEFLHLLFNPEDMSKEACFVCMVGIYAVVALMYIWAI